MADYPVDRVGKQLGPYYLTRLLGRGGFGEVYEVEHRLLHQQRAIKLLLECHFHDPKARERFLREARTLAGLDHPNILPLLEVDEAGNLLYLVMPLYQRGTLSDLLKQRATPLPLTEVEQFLSQVCAALGHAHARGIAHLDLKPENLLLHEDGRLVLADFGLAHLLKRGRLEAGTSASWGTPFYMAPEQIRGEPEPRSDLYALGVILYHLLTMQRPFTGKTPEAVMMKHLLEAPPALQTAYPQALAALEPVVQKALAKQPTDRYPTPEALLADFRAALGSPVSPPAQPPAPAAGAVWGLPIVGTESRIRKVAQTASQVDQPQLPLLPMKTGRQLGSASNPQPAEPPSQQTKQLPKRFSDQHQDEKVILFMRKHWWSLIKPGWQAIVLLVMLNGVIIAHLLTPVLYSPLWVLLEAIIGVTFLVFLLRWAYSEVSYWWFTIYILTDRRIIISHGWRKPMRKEASLDEIQQVNMDTRNPWAYLLDFGDVIILTAAGPIDFSRVARPRMIVDTILATQGQFSAARKPIA